MAYLNPLQAVNGDDNHDVPHVGATRVMHRKDMQQPSLPLPPSQTQL